MTETVKQMARDLGPGEARSGLLCPRCHGGSSGERSLSVYRTADGVGGKCHRASCGLNVFRSAFTIQTEPVAFKPRPYPFPLQTPARSHPVWGLLGVRPPVPSSRLAAQLGVLARSDNANEVVWEVRDYEWSARGHVSRTYPGKRILTWRTVEGPFYAYHGASRAAELWIVEDMVSAAKIALAGGNAVALLGTHFSKDGQRELGQYLARLRFPRVRVRVALDPDAVRAELGLVRELTNRIGYDTIPSMLPNDPKDLPEGELERMVREGMEP